MTLLQTFLWELVATVAWAHCQNRLESSLDPSPVLLFAIGKEIGWPRRLLLLHFRLGEGKLVLRFCQRGGSFSFWVSSQWPTCETAASGRHWVCADNGSLGCFLVGGKWGLVCTLVCPVGSQLLFWLWRVADGLQREPGVDWCNRKTNQCNSIRSYCESSLSFFSFFFTNLRLFDN